MFVSYVEIYNETIFDLLEPPPPRHGKRTPLRLGEDTSADVYLKGKGWCGGGVCGLVCLN